VQVIVRSSSVEIADGDVRDLVEELSDWAIHEPSCGDCSLCTKPWVDVVLQD